MSRIVELTVPDIGNFKDVPVIEVLVQPGETIATEAPLVTLESEKATMEVPASAGGVVKDVKVHVGDKVSQGSLLATLEVAEEAGTAAPAAQAPAPAAATASNGASNGAPVAPAPEVPAARRPAPSERPTTVELSVPDLGSFKDIPVIEILVHPGEEIAVDTPLVMLESEKATMEVPATTAGIVRDLRVKVGDKVSTGSVLATLDVSPVVTDGKGSPAEPAASALAPAAAADVATTPAEPRPEPVSAAATAPSAPAAPAAAPVQFTVHASPAIRRFARELGVELSRVKGTGPNGRVTRDDVQGFVKGALTQPPAATNGASLGGGLNLLPWPKVDFGKFGPIARKPLTRIQKLSGPNLARNWAMIPHVTQNDEADVTELEEFRKQLNAEQKDAKVTMLAFLLKACASALRRFPDFNASLDGDELVVKQYYHLGFAADTPSGLLVPVIRDVDQKGIIELARETAELATKARDGKLRLSDMEGGTFSVSSLGGIGGTHFSPIINAPQVAILGAGRAGLKPVWDATQFVPRLMLPLSLSYDHRVIDGAKGARFITSLSGLLADLRRTLL